MTAVTTLIESSPQLKRLTAEQLRAYETDGFVVVPDVFPVAELEAIDQEIDRLITIPGNDAGAHRAGWIMGVSQRSEIAERFAEHERLVAPGEGGVRPRPPVPPTKGVPKPPPPP